MSAAKPWTWSLLTVLALLPAAAQPTGPAELGGAGPWTFAAQRSFLRTVRGDHAQAAFQAEVTVTVRGGGGNGCAFFGLGQGQPDHDNYDEPSTAPALVLRLGPSDFAGGQLVVTANRAVVADPEHLGDGTHRLRLTWDPALRRAWFEVHPNWSAGAAFAPQFALAAPAAALDFAQAGHLFVGGAGGVSFADFDVHAAAAADLARLAASDAFAGDKTADTWLPTATAGRSASPEADRFLRELGAHLRPLACWYHGAALRATREFADGRLDLPGSHWRAEIGTRPVQGDPRALDLTATFTLCEGAAREAGVALAIDFDRWDTGNYTLLPASVYNGNRLRTVDRAYAAGLDPADHYRPDLPLTQSDVPRLADRPGERSRLEVSACNVATPALALYDRRAGRGFILLAEQAGRGADGDWLRRADGEVLDNGFVLEESADRRQATMVVSAPGVRSRRPEFIGFGASPDRGMTLGAGQSITLRLRLYSFAAPGIPGLLDRFASVRKALTGPNHPRPLVPASQVAAWMTQRIDGRFHDQPGAQFYCPENAPWIAFGWIGGWIDTFPMLVLGDEQHLARVSQTFDYGLKAQEPSGYFHYAIDASGNTTFRDPGPDMNLARTNGDVLYWMVKQFELLTAQDRAQAIRPAWTQSMRRLAEALVATWRQDHQWGKLINVKTGRVAEFNTTGGATVVAGLALASRYFDAPDYLRVAREAATFYYDRDFVAQGLTTGSCADILQNAESESAAGLMMGLAALYEVTGERQWLERSRNLANLVATWTVSHDYELPRSTELGGLGARLAGVVWASTQNKHGAPGICTNSGDALLRIYRATGDERYAELLRDIIAAHGESLRPGGYTNERLTYCDADSRGTRGGHVTGWNETNGALMAMEIPGLYLRCDNGRLYVFDAVRARVVSRGASGVRLAITNPTPFDARVSLLAEDAAAAGRPLGYTALLRWPRVEVKAGATVEVTVRPDGTVTR